MWDPIRSKQEEEPESVLSESDLGRREGRCWSAGLKLCLDGGHLETPSLIQNEQEKRGARAGRAGELLVCGQVTLRTRVMWSLASGKWDCELEEGDNACQSSEGCTLARARTFPGVPDTGGVGTDSS